MRLVYHGMSRSYSSFRVLVREWGPPADFIRPLEGWWSVHKQACPGARHSSRRRTLPPSRSPLADYWPGSRGTLSLEGRRALPTNVEGDERERENTLNIRGKYKWDFLSVRPVGLT